MKIKQALNKYYELCEKHNIKSDIKTKEMKELATKFYDVSKILSYKNEYTYFCSISPRNVGKTFNIKEHFLTKCFKQGGCIIWLRRDVEQLKMINHDWISKLQHLGYLQNNKFRKFTASSKGVICVLFDENGKPFFKWTLCYFFSIIHENRVQGQDFINPLAIIYDEILVPDGRYKKNESKALQSIANSFFRNSKMLIYGICNHVTKVNWYFDLINLQFDKEKEFLKSSFKSTNLKGEEIKVNCITHNFKYNEIQKEYHNKLDVMSKLRGDYLKFSQGKSFYLDSDKNIVPTNDKNLKHLYNVKYDGEYIGVYKFNSFLYIAEMKESKYNYYMFKEDCNIDEINFYSVGFSLIHDTLNGYKVNNRIVYKNLRYKKVVEKILKQKRENN